MKRKAIAVIIAVAAITMTGCTEDTEHREGVAGETQLKGQLECIVGNKLCSEWRDNETGVHYYYTQYGGLTVRVNADGTPYTD